MEDLKSYITEVPVLIVLFKPLSIPSLIEFIYESPPGEPKEIAVSPVTSVSESANSIGCRFLASARRTAISFSVTIRV